MAFISSTPKLSARIPSDNIVHSQSTETSTDNTNKPSGKSTESSSADSHLTTTKHQETTSTGSETFTGTKPADIVLQTIDRAKLAHKLRTSTIQLTSRESGILRLLDRVARNYESMTGQKIHIRVAGGWVRDKLLGLQSSDIDIAVDKMMGHDFAILVHEYQGSKGFKIRPISKIEANPDKSKHLETAIMHVMGVTIDVANLRSDVLDDSARFLNEPIFGTPYEDAHYRDFTINALFYNIRTNSVEDFTGRGLEDLMTGLIRTPLNAMETFWQDPLRVLRCIRFAGRFQFKIASDAVNAMLEPKIRDALRTKVSKERKGIELTKILEDGVGRATSLRLFKEMNLYDLILPPPQLSILVKETSEIHGERTDIDDVYKLFWLLDWLMKINPSVTKRDWEVERSIAFKPEEIPQHDILTKEVKSHGIASHLRIAIPTEPPTEEEELAQFNFDQVFSSKVIPRGMFFTALLYPYRNVYTIVNNREMSGAAWMCRYRIKMPKKDTVYMSNLHNVIKKIHSTVNVVGGRKGQITEKVSKNDMIATGILVKEVSERTGSGAWWPSTIIFALATDLLPNFEHLSQGKLDNDSRVTISKYNQFLSKVEDYGMENIYSWKNIISTSDLFRLLGSNINQRIPEYNERILAWQLENPYGTKEECEDWILDNPAFSKRGKGPTYANRNNSNRN
ncbi:CCA tRNA nucleotidyltransferase, mitochondrial [Entomortierella beljakovae]|nr:CCA tRNA nucleotidyltransferase, mitochondrial [Entomortierella beljakovae]